MRFMKTLFFTLLTLSSFAQKAEKFEIRPPKVFWDIQFSYVLSWHNGESALLGGTLQANCRFKNYLYLSSSFVEAENIFVDFSIAPAFGVSPPISTETAKLRSFSFVSGGYYQNRYFLITGGAGINVSKIYVKNIDTKSVLGLDFRGNLVVPIKRHFGLVFGFNYNLNKIKDFKSVLLGINYTF
jgi:hypothetical protein